MPNKNNSVLRKKLGYKILKPLNNYLSYHFFARRHSRGLGCYDTNHRYHYERCHGHGQPQSKPRPSHGAAVSRPTAPLAPPPLPRHLLAGGRSRRLPTAGSDSRRGHGGHGSRLAGPGRVAVPLAGRPGDGPSVGRHHASEKRAGWPHPSPARCLGEL